MTWHPSWRCRHGLHRFVFVSMSNQRDVAAWSECAADFRCHLVERCDRCGLRRENTYAKVPRRVRVGKRSFSEMTISDGEHTETVAVLGGDL